MISRMTPHAGKLREIAVMKIKEPLSQVNGNWVIYLPISNGLKTESADHWVQGIHVQDILVTKPITHR
jgi:hypothetical protein